MNIEFLISTTNKTDTKFLNRIFGNINIGSDNFKATVINQCYRFMPQKIDSNRSNITILSVEDRGLSKSRNMAIQKASEDICVIADDDVIYLKDSIENIKKEYEEDAELDVGIFQIVTPEGDKYKKYSPKSYIIKSPFKIMQVSSIEITFRVKRITENNISFNEQMGLGAKYVLGEESLFIHDCVKKGLKVKFIPVPIVIHPKESSAMNFSKERIMASGIIYAKLFSILFPLVDIYFAIKRYKRYRGKFTLLSYLSYLVQGNLLSLRHKV